MIKYLDPPPPPVVLQAQDIYKEYQDGKNTLQILNGINLELTSGEMLAIVGSSGSGKSTLMHILGLLDKPTSGDVLIGEQPTSGLSERQRSDIRNEKLGFVYQFHHLLPEFSALDNVAMPLIVRRISRSKAREKAMAVLDSVGLADRARHNPGELSGGERQRVAIARALVANPLCVLADEPTGNLDTHTAEQIFELLINIRKEFSTAFMIVTHDLKLAAMADRRLQMSDGVLSEE